MRFLQSIIPSLLLFFLKPILLFLTIILSRLLFLFIMFLSRLSIDSWLLLLMRFVSSLSRKLRFLCQRTNIFRKPSPRQNRLPFILITIIIIVDSWTFTFFAGHIDIITNSNKTSYLSSKVENYNLLLFKQNNKNNNDTSSGLILNHNCQLLKIN